jgi:hypothetical protein
MAGDEELWSGRGGLLSSLRAACARERAPDRQGLAAVETLRNCRRLEDMAEERKR